MIESMDDDPTKARKAWLGLLSLFTVGSLVETIFYGQISAFTPMHLPNLGVPFTDIPRWTGIIASVSGLIGLPFLPLWGALADRYARKPVIIRTFAVHLLAVIVALLAGNVWVFLIGRSISSFGLGNSGLMMATLAERVPIRRQGLAFAIMNSAAPIGVFIGPLIGGPIVDRWGVRLLLGIDAVLLLGVVLAMTFGYRDAYTGQNRGPLLRMAYDSLGILWHSRRLRTLLPALFLLFAGWVMAMTYVPVVVGEMYTGQNLGSMVGVVMGAGGFLALIIGPAMGALADRFGHWRVLFLGALILVLLWPLPLLTSQLVGLGAAWALINGLASGVFSVSFNVLASSASDSVRGRVMSFAYLPVNIGGILGPALGAYLTQTNVMAVFPAAAVITALGLATLLLAARFAE
ncbi:MAG TPA: MFS transporter [Anaerolineales bacterium]|nr:MFS transporter [Anaerolineales bacterium]